MKIDLYVESETLPDGSKVYGVHIGEYRFTATDYEAAIALAEQICDAINDFTVEDSAEVIDDTVQMVTPDKTVEP